MGVLPVGCTIALLAAGRCPKVCFEPRHIHAEGVCKRLKARGAAASLLAVRAFRVSKNGRCAWRSATVGRDERRESGSELSAVGEAYDGHTGELLLVFRFYDVKGARFG
jgi:hypothetical protein